MVSVAIEEARHVVSLPGRTGEDNLQAIVQERIQPIPGLIFHGTSEANRDGMPGSQFPVAHGVQNRFADHAEKRVVFGRGDRVFLLVQTESDRNHVPRGNHEQIIVVVTAARIRAQGRVRPTPLALGCDPVGPPVVAVDARTLAVTAGQGVWDGSRNLHSRGLIDPVGFDQASAVPIATVQEKVAESGQILGRNLDAPRPIQDLVRRVPFPIQTIDSDGLEDSLLQIILQGLAGDPGQSVSVVLRGLVPIHVLRARSEKGRQRLDQCVLISATLVVIVIAATGAVNSGSHGGQVA